MSDTDDFIKIFLVIVVAVCFVIGMIAFSVYNYKSLEMENFQTTMKNLTGEQKCLHICGFEFDDAFEKYKFCAEKCVAISEVAHENN